MPSPSTPPLTRRSALAASALTLAGTAGCLDRVQDRLQPRTHHSDATLGDFPGPWATFGRDMFRSGSRPAATTLAADPTAERVASTGQYAHGTPVVAGDTVYSPRVREADGEATAETVATARDGEVRWRVPHEKPQASPTVVGETVFLVAGNRVIAVDRASGETHWEYATGGGHGSVTVSYGTLFVDGRRVVALDAATGEREWAADEEENWRGGTATATENLYAVGEANDHGDEGATFYGFDLTDGEPRFSTSLDASTTTPPVVAENVVVVTESTGTLRGIEGWEGTKKWTYALDRTSRAGPAVADETAFVVENGTNTLHALNSTTGERRWTAPLGSTIDHRPAVADEAVYVFGSDPGEGSHALLVIDGETGERRRTVPVPFDPSSGPVLADDAVFAYGGPGERAVWRLG